MKAQIINYWTDEEDNEVEDIVDELELEAVHYGFNNSLIIILPESIHDTYLNIFTDKLDKRYIEIIQRSSKDKDGKKYQNNYYAIIQSKELSYSHGQIIRIVA